MEYLILVAFIIFIGAITYSVYKTIQLSWLFSKLKISVIIPTYNRATLTKRAIESVLNQNIQPYEIIVVDDGSTDNTKEVLQSFGDKIVTIYQKNSGVSVARNRGIKEAKGEWLALLDSDDIWLNKKLSTQISYHKNNPHIKISQTNEEWLRDGEVIKQPKKYKKKAGYIFKDILTHSTISPSTIVTSREIFDNIGYFDESLNVCEDYDLWLRVALKYEIGLIEEILTIKYGGHIDQLSTTTWGMNRFRVEALEKHIDSEFKEDVLKVIIKKCQTLKKGALKRDNLKTYNIYNQKQILYEKKLKELSWNFKNYLNK